MKKFKIRQDIEISNNQKLDKVMNDRPFNGTMYQVIKDQISVESKIAVHILKFNQMDI